MKKSKEGNGYEESLFILTVMMSMAALKVEVSVGYGNVIGGEMAASMNLNDRSGFAITDTGGGVASLKIFTVYYPDYDDPPMYQTCNASLSYSYPITLYYDSTDSEGNPGRVSLWGDPSSGHLPLGKYTVHWGGDIGVYVGLDGLRDSTQFPILISFTPDVSKYLEATPDIQSNDPTISDLAQNLVSGSDREPEAVVKIMNWVADDVQYNHGPDLPEDALSINPRSTAQGEMLGLCQSSDSSSEKCRHPGENGTGGNHRQRFLGAESEWGLT